MEEKHYILTGLTAYARLPRSGQTDDPFPFSAEKSTEVFKKFLRYVNTVPTTSITLRPLIVAWKREPFRKRGWTYEFSDSEEQEMYIGHFDSLYEVSLTNTEFMPHQIIDAIHASRAILKNTFGSELALVEINQKDIPRSRTFLVSQLELLHQGNQGRLARDDFAQLFSLRSGSSGSTDERMWKLLPAFLRDEKLLYAALFLKASHDEYIFQGDDIEEAILKNDGPIHVHDAVRAENAIHNAYKVIEALWGGTLPTDAKKMDKGLKAIGINPDELVGYQHHGIYARQKIKEKLALLRKARDERAAHGRIGRDRKATYYEILDYQALAHTVLWRYITWKWPHCI